MKRRPKANILNDAQRKRATFGSGGTHNFDVKGVCFRIRALEIRSNVKPEQMLGFLVDSREIMKRINGRS